MPETFSWYVNGDPYSADLINTPQRQLGELVAHAKKNSPYLAELYKDIDINDFSIEQLPVLDKRMLRENFGRFLTNTDLPVSKLNEYFAQKFDFNRRFEKHYYAFHSSGSSGQPSHVVWDEREFEISCGLILATALGMNYSQDVVNRLSYIGILDDYIGGNSWVYALRKYVDVNMISIFSDLAVITSVLNKYQPTILASKPTVLANFARLQQQGRLRLNNLKTIIFAGENITAGDIELIKDTFKTIPINSYSTCETGPIARQVDNRQVLKVIKRAVIVEILDEYGRRITEPRIDGRVVVSVLYNYLTPIIRYDTGDIASIVTISDSVEEISYIKGRNTKMLEFHGGAEKWSVAEYPFWSLYVPGLQRYQIIQTSPSSLTANLEYVNDSSPWSEKNDIRHRFHEKLVCAIGEERSKHIEINYNLDTPIKPAQNGKIRVVVPYSASC